MAEDIQTMEHLGEWDHGIEPDVLQASSVNQKDSVAIRLKGHEDDEDVAKKRIVQTIRTSMTRVLQDISQQVKTFRDDEHLKESMRDHTEEEVAGMHLCVSELIHQSSFEAP